MVGTVHNNFMVVNRNLYMHLFVNTTQAVGVNDVPEVLSIRLNGVSNHNYLFLYYNNQPMKFFNLYYFKDYNYKIIHEHIQQLLTN